MKNNIILAAKFIKNMSQHKLTNHEILVLGKGLKFIPTPKKPQINEIVKDWQDLSKRMRYKYIYANKTKTQIPPFYEKSKKYPGPIENVGLENFLCQVRHDFERIFSNKTLRRPKYNITQKERVALQSLRNNKDIVIRKADKANTTCIMDKTAYLKEGLRQLTSAQHYKPIHKDITEETQKMVNDVLKKIYIAGEMNKQTWDFLEGNDKNVKTPQLYLLPKIHKPIITGRPIIAGIGGPLEKISTFVDYFLKPIVTQQPTYVKDTSDFIKKIEQTNIPEHAILVTADIESMYTNIPHLNALESVKKALHANANIKYKICRPSIQHLIDLLELLLTRNTFQFNSENYIQTCGCPMGQPASPEITIHELELSLINKAGCKMKSFMRYRDDIFYFWLGTTLELEKFMMMANQFHPTLKFTYECSTECVTFLDTEIYKGERFNKEGILDIRTHTKPTNTFQYLHRTSCHPNSVFKGFIKGELLRYVRNSSNKSDFETIKKAFQTRLLNRGYKKADIDAVVSQIDHGNRKLTLQTGFKNKNDTDTPLVFTTTHNPYMPNLKRILVKHWHYIENVPQLKQIFPQLPTMAFRKNKSIYNYIVRAKIQATNHGNMDGCNNDDDDDNDVNDDNYTLTQLIDILEADPDAN
jgi:hypothetical protein